jgi:hypothetical protein
MMDTKFVEAGHPGVGNWGKFIVACHTTAELQEPTQFPGCEGQRVVSLAGNGARDMWVFDLQTGEGFRVPVSERHAFSILEKHQVWVCPMFEPFLGWLLAYIDSHPNDWWSTLPRTVELPDAPFEMRGHRRPTARPAFQVELLDGRVVDWEWTQGAPALSTSDDAWRLVFRVGQSGPGWYLHGPGADGLMMGSKLEVASMYAALAISQGTAVVEPPVPD